MLSVNTYQAIGKKTFVLMRVFNNFLLFPNIKCLAKYGWALDNPFAKNLNLKVIATNNTSKTICPLDDVNISRTDSAIIS